MRFLRRSTHYVHQPLVALRPSSTHNSHRKMISAARAAAAPALRRAGVCRPRALQNVRPTSILRNMSTAEGAGATAKGAAKPPAKPTAAAGASKGSKEEASIPLGKTVVAMVAGVLTVSAGAAVVESATAADCPPFDPSGERFDQTTFFGRFCKMILGTDPRLLTYSDEDCRRAGDMVANHAALIANPIAGMNNVHHALWEAQRISGAALHPDSGDTIPQPFRMSGYVPFNGPICVAMVASQSTTALLFWSWVNQSQNALVNYFNRNASSEMSNETMMKSYGIAVGSALTVAFGLATFIQKRYDPVVAKKLMSFVAFPSAIVASSINCYIVRSPEIDTGVSLVDSNGKDVLPGEKSFEAARRGVNSTTLSRAIVQAPVYFLPPVLIRTVFSGFVAANPAMTVPLTTYLLLVSFGVGLPSTLAIFPQMSEIRPEEAEEKFHNLRDATGKLYEALYYNKGL